MVGRDGIEPPTPGFSVLAVNPRIVRHFIELCFTARGASSRHVAVGCSLSRDLLRISADRSITWRRTEFWRGTTSRFRQVPRPRLHRVRPLLGSILGVLAVRRLRVRAVGADRRGAPHIHREASGGLLPERTGALRRRAVVCEPFALRKRRSRRAAPASRRRP